MEKAYDLKALVSKFKERGLDVAEDTVKALLHDSFDWLADSAKISQNPYDDMALVILPKIKEAALGLADKIDNKEG